jgi:hypothetical protein
MDTEEFEAELARRYEEVPALRAEQHRAEVQPAIDKVMDRLSHLSGLIWRASSLGVYEKYTETLRELLDFELEDLRENERAIAYCKRLDEADIAGPRIKALLQTEES